MLYIHVTPQAEDDLALIARNDPRSAARLLVLLQEIGGNQRFLEDLLTHGAIIEDLPSFDEVTVKRIHGAHRHRVPLWRLSCIDLEGIALPYRVLYLFEQAGPPNWKPIIHLVAAARRREIDYDNLSNPYIARAYDYWRSL